MWVYTLSRAVPPWYKKPVGLRPPRQVVPHVQPRVLVERPCGDAKLRVSSSTVTQLRCNLVQVLTGAHAWLQPSGLSICTAVFVVCPPQGPQDRTVHSLLESAAWHRPLERGLGCVGAPVPERWSSPRSVQTRAQPNRQPPPSSRVLWPPSALSLLAVCT